MPMNIDLLVMRNFIEPCREALETWQGPIIIIIIGIPQIRNKLLLIFNSSPKETKIDQVIPLFEQYKKQREL